MPCVERWGGDNQPATFEPVLRASGEIACVIMHIDAECENHCEKSACWILCAADSVMLWIGGENTTEPAHVSRLLKAFPWLWSFAAHSPYRQARPTDLGNYCSCCCKPPEGSKKLIATAKPAVRIRTTFSVLRSRHVPVGWSFFFSFRRLRGSSWVLCWTCIN